MVEATKKIEPTRLAEFEHEILLKDGTSMLLRPIVPGDAEIWLKFLNSLSVNEKYIRFQHMTRDMTPEAAVRFCGVDHCDTCAIVAEVMRDSGKEIVATGKYYRLPDKHSAEIILAVADDYQGRGLGTSILEQLMSVARQNGIDTFKGDVLACDTYALSIFKNYGFNLTLEAQGDAYRIIFPITPTPVTQQK